jgi:hypothetical protein
MSFIAVPVATGFAAGNAYRRQREQQAASFPPVPCVGDQFINSQKQPVPYQSKINFGASREHHTFKNKLLKTNKELEALDAEADWQYAKKNLNLSDEETRRLLYKRYNLAEKAGHSKDMTDFVAAAGGGTAGAVVGLAVTCHPQHAVAAAGATAAVSKPAAVIVTDIADGIYKLFRPCSPIRSNIQRKVDHKMAKLKAKKN